MFLKKSKPSHGDYIPKWPSKKIKTVQNTGSDVTHLSGPTPRGITRREPMGGQKVNTGE